MTTREPVADGRAAPPSDPDAIRADIEQTRAQLGDTVEALAAKADVKSRAKEKVVEARTRVGSQVELARQRVEQKLPPKAREIVGQAGAKARDQKVPLAVAAGVVVLLVIVVRQRRRR
jgi:hypothetical protein